MRTSQFKKTYHHHLYNVTLIDNYNKTRSCNYITNDDYTINVAIYLKLNSNYNIHEHMCNFEILRVCTVYIYIYTVKLTLKTVTVKN